MSGSLPAVDARGSDPISVYGNTRGVTIPRSSAPIYSQWLGIWDTAFVGTMIGWERDTTGEAAARWLGIETYPFVFKCRVDSILLGGVSDSTVEFRKPDFAFAEERLHAGARMLVMVRRSRSDRTIGNFLLIGEQGELLADQMSWSEESAKKVDARPLTVQDLSLDSIRACGPANQLQDVDGIAMVKIRRLDSNSRPKGCGYPCALVTSTEWLISGKSGMPKYLRLRSTTFEQGLDSQRESQFVIGVPSEFKGEVLELKCSIRWLRVIDGILPALGMTPTQVVEHIHRNISGKLVWKQ